LKISAFTFIKNGSILGYPFIESIKSVLPIVDEFIVNVGYSEDDTLSRIQSIRDPKIKILESQWNETMADRGYVYGQQKMIAQFNCQGDWAFYVEADEVYHENDLDELVKIMSDNLEVKRVEALAVNFHHFYGSAQYVLDSPGWYRSEVRIIRNNVRSYAPDGLFWVILDKNKVGRYPYAIKTPVSCYHYGWIRLEEQMNLKSKKVQKYWGGESKIIKYANIDFKILKEFFGSHPSIAKNWLEQNSNKDFSVSKSYKISSKQKKHRIMMFFEKIFKVDLSKKHYKDLSKQK